MASSTGTGSSDIINKVGAPGEVRAALEGAKRIDAYTHFCCEEFVAYMEEQSGKPMVFRGLFSRIPELTDIEARIRYMDDHGIDVHCLVPLPWLESEPALHADAAKAEQACKVANDAMAKLVASHPGRFVGVALIPTTTEEVMVRETERAVMELGLAGVAMFVGPTAKPPDDASFEGLYRRCEALGAVIWVHPCRPQWYADYDAYKGRGGSLHQLWNTFGWIYDTSVAMVHIVLAGVFQRYPELKVVSHHHGGMVPFFTERFNTQMKNFNQEGAEDLMADLHKFYCDTATFGTNTANIQAAIDFFGLERVLFGTDTPMDMGQRGYFTTTTKESVEGLGISDDAKEDIYHRNVARMLGVQGRQSTAAESPATSRPPSGRL